jgi:hypothetical protein
VKKTEDSIPEAAAVVARIVVGQIRSRSPPHAMIVSLFFFSIRLPSAYSSTSTRRSRSASWSSEDRSVSVVATPLTAS